MIQMLRKLFSSVKSHEPAVRADDGERLNSSVQSDAAFNIAGEDGDVLVVSDSDPFVFVAGRTVPMRTCEVKGFEQVLVIRHELGGRRG